MSETITIPAAIDLHVHLREPGDNKSETIEGGTRAAMLGGFAMVADMPNNPNHSTWRRERLDEKTEIAGASAWIPAGFYAGSQPDAECDNVGELGSMAERAIGLKLYGAPTTGNKKTYEGEDFREIVTEWHRVAPDKPIMFHAGENNLEAMISQVAVELKHPFHVCHVNSSSQVELVYNEKMRGHPVTCGVCPHHLLKSSHDVHSQGAFATMMPPLAHQDEAEKLMAMLEAGYIDVIESDFAPHSTEAKLDAENSGGHCYGLPGIENIMPLLLYQVRKMRLSERRFIEVMVNVPAAILGVNVGKGTTAKLNMSEGVYRLGESDVEASCGWSPYLGMLALGRLEELKISGKTVVRNGKAFAKSPAIISDRGTVI